MPRRGRPETREERGEDEADAPGRLRPFWSGTVAFGLVSLPVSLYAATKRARAALRMVTREGMPLERRYVSSRDGRELDTDDIVRGYEVDEGRFVVVEDEELEALAPEKSQEIDLTRFVPRDEIDPTYFDRGYFLAPDPGALKAYRLLVKSMEDAGRAGIATFVMRGKEYLVAILAEDGLLRAETMRFQDELRTPEEVGLPAIGEPDGKRLRAIERALGRLEVDELDRSLLTDDTTQRLLELAEAKREAGEDVVELPPEAAERQGRREEVDLMQVLKRSLEGDAGSPASRPSGDGAASGNRTKAELYARARELGIEGRSAMSKEELLAAIDDAGRARGGRA